MTSLPTFGTMRLLDAEAVRSLSFPEAVDALEDAIRSGFDPEDDVARVRVPTPTGVLLVMPSTLGGWTGTKLLSSVGSNPERGLPILQGNYTLFEGDGQVPVAMLDGIALTELRTPAVSVLGIRHLAPAPAEPENLLVFGTGVQGLAHARAVAAERTLTSTPLASITLVNPDGASAEAAAEALAADLEVPVRGVAQAQAADAVREAHLICCCTPAKEPLFDGSLLREDAVVVAMGSHFPDDREVDDAVVSRAQVVVESRTGVLAEGGDVVIPLASGVLKEDEIVTLRQIVTREVPVGTGPRFFKTTGMPWEDLVVATAVHRRC